MPARFVRDAIRVLKKLGCGVDIEENRHCKVYVNLDGCRFIWVAPMTPSDVRAQKNAIAQLKRELRSCGCNEPPRFGYRGDASTTDGIDALWRVIKAAEEAAEPGQA